MFNQVDYKKKSIIIRESNPQIIFYFNNDTDISLILKYSEILKQLNIPPRKWYNNQEWVYEQVMISVSFEDNMPIHFNFQGSENLQSWIYFASLNIYQNNKEQLDRTRCYELKPDDINILNSFFVIAPSIKDTVFHRIWFNEFPSGICDNSNIQNIEFYSCRIDKFPDNFKNLCNLEKIYMEFSWAQMPNSFANCKNLKKLEFREACLIDKFPEDIGNCLKLQELEYAESLSYNYHQKLAPLIRDKTGITTLPASIGKIPNLTKIKLRNCVNLRSLPEELAIFPWKEIRLDNSGYKMKNEKYLSKSLRNYVLIDWNYGEDFNFYNVNDRVMPNFDHIIEKLSPIYESLQKNAFLGLIDIFPEKRIQIMRILEIWCEKTSDPTNKKIFRDFIDKFSLKIDFSSGDKLFL